MKDVFIKKFPKLFPYLVTFSAALFFAYELMQFHMMNAIAPLLMRDLSMNATAFGNLCSVYLFADVLVLLPAGILLDRFSTRRIILSALLLCLIGTFGFAFATNFASAAFCHFLSGIGNAFCFLSCMMLIARWFPEEKQSFIVGLVITVGMLGGVIAQSPIAYLASLFTWRKTLLFDGFVGVAIYALIYLFVHDREVKKTSDTALPFWQSVRLSLANIKNLSAGFYTAFLNLPLMLLGATFGSLFLMQVHGLSLAKSSLISSMICMGTIVGSPIYGHVANKYKSRSFWLFFGTMTTLVTIMAILFAPTGKELLLLTLFFLLGLFSSSQILSYPIIAEVNPKELTGTSMGIAGMAVMGLPMIAGPFVGFLLDKLWTGTMMGDTRLYSPTAFLIAFSIFPLTLLLSLFTTLPLYQSPKKAAS
jgi:MFS family permease